MYILTIIGDMVRIARNLENVEDSIFGPKPNQHFNLDDNDIDAVDNNDDNLTNIEVSSVKNTKLSRKQNSNNSNRNGLI